MKRKLPNEFLFTIVALLISTVIVHALYVLHVRPVAEATMRADRERMLKDPNYVQQRSIYVVIKDYEQEVCFMLALWSVAIMGYKGFSLRRGQSLLGAIEQAAIGGAPLDARPSAPSSP